MRLALRPIITFLSLSLTFNTLPIAAHAAASKAPKNGIVVDASTNQLYYIDKSAKAKIKLGSDIDHAYERMLAVSTPIAGDDFFHIPLSGETYGSDFDADGLSDALELETIYAFVLNPNLPDTDGDGYDDRTELLNGYNPNNTQAPGFDGFFPKSKSIYKKYRAKLIATSDNAIWYVHPTNGKKQFVGHNNELVSIFLDHHAKSVNHDALSTVPTGTMSSTHCGSFGIAITEESASFEPQRVIDCANARISACETTTYIAVLPLVYTEFLYEISRDSNGACMTKVTALNRIIDLVSKNASMTCPVTSSDDIETMYKYILPDVEGVVPSQACTGKLANEMRSWAEEL